MLVFELQPKLAIRSNGILGKLGCCVQHILIHCLPVPCMQSDSCIPPLLAAPQGTKVRYRNSNTQQYCRNENICVQNKLYHRTSACASGDNVAQTDANPSGLNGQAFSQAIASA